MGRRRAWHYPQYLGSTQALSTVPTLPTVPRLYLQYPECPATGITLALDCYYLAPALHTQQPSLFGGRLLWRSMLLGEQNKKRLRVIYNNYCGGEREQVLMADTLLQ